MTTPVRIQRRRTRGYDMQAESRAINGLPAVYVGRPTVFGNVHACTRPHNCALQPCACCDDATDGRNWCCLIAYREYVTSGIEGRPSSTGTFRYGMDAIEGYPIRNELVRRLPELRNHNLACWCPLPEPGQPDLCHAAVLLEILAR